MADEIEDKENEEETVEDKEPKEPESRSLTQEDINKLIEAARKQEKDKLYGTINTMKSQMDDMAAQAKADKEAKEKAEKDAKEKAEAERLKGLSEAERMSEQLKKFEQRLERESKEREELQVRLDQERAERELLEYKTQILNDAGDDLIKELVSGSTKDEILRSVDLAKAKYKQYFDATVETAEGNNGRKIQKTGQTLPGPTDADTEEALGDALRGLNLQVDPDDISHTKVSEDYKKNREKILAQVADAYKRSQ